MSMPYVLMVHFVFMFVDSKENPIIRVRGKSSAMMMMMMMMLLSMMKMMMDAFNIS